jgi:hypothetical protein
MLCLEAVGCREINYNKKKTKNARMNKRGYERGV